MFTLKQVEKVIEELKKKYPCFVSERHLQTAFTIKAAELYKNDGFEFLPELSPDENDIPAAQLYRHDFDDNIVNNNKRDIHLDLFIKSPDNKNTIIEFKYKTKRTDEPVLIDGMDVSLSDHKDTTNGRYAVWADIHRIESFCLESKLNVHNGFSIFITNNETYLATPRSNSFSKPFSLMRDCGSRKAWCMGENGEWPEGSVINENRSPLSFKYKYPLVSVPYNEKLGFKLLLTEVPSGERWQET